MIKEETKRTTREDITKLRTRDSYDEIIKQISSGEKPDYKETLGVKRFCYLNNLKYFHILDNFNLDIFHDLEEGSIPRLLELFVGFGIREKVFTEKEINDAFTFFDYGPLNKKCILSTISLTKRHLGQNASQIRCMLFNFPFVMKDFKDHEALQGAWKCINSMLKIVRIVYSTTIHENDLKLLEDLVSQHLDSVIECFGVELRPKQHNMTHMATSVRMVGNLIHNSTLKFEMKHKVFSSYIRKIQNFKNVSKSLAENYQMKTLKHCYQNKIKSGRRLVLRIDDIYKALLDTFDLEKLTELKSLTFNSNYYEKGLFLKSGDKFYRIEKVLLYEIDYYFLCIEYFCHSFDDFLNAIKIEESSPKSYKLLCRSEVLYKKSHSHRQLGNSTFIISDTIQLNFE